MDDGRSRRVSRRRVTGIAAAAAVVVIAAAVLVAVPVGRADAASPIPTRRVWVQGDSVLLGAVNDVQADLTADGWNPMVNAFGGLQLVAAIGLFREEQANLGSAVVIELGNNYCCDLAPFSGQIDAAMAAIGPRHVIWLTTALFEPRQQQINALIVQGAARWPNAEVADWGAEVASNPQAVGPDGLHLTLAGRSLLTAFIHSHLDAWYRRQVLGPSRPVVDAFGAAPTAGPSGQQTIAGLPTSAAPTPDGGGYWMAESDGSVDAEGDARSFGSLGPAWHTPIVAIAATHDGGGYWLAASNGAVFAFGDATAHGSAAAFGLNQPVVGMAPTPDGGGYWLVAADGGVFAFGDAVFHGSMGGVALDQPIVGMAATPDGRGYWLVAADGGVFALGDAPFEGSTGAMHLTHPVESMAATPDGRGYWLRSEEHT